MRAARDTAQLLKVRWCFHTGPVSDKVTGSRPLGQVSIAWKAVVEFDNIHQLNHCYCQLTNHPDSPAPPSPLEDLSFIMDPSASLPPGPSSSLGLPSLLHPLSPQLSALHLARIRLLQSTSNNTNASGSGSASPTKSKLAGTWACEHCGHLRSGWGWKVVRVQRVLGTTSAEGEGQGEGSMTTKKKVGPGAGRNGERDQKEKRIR